MTDVNPNQENEEYDLDPEAGLAADGRGEDDDS